MRLVGDPPVNGAGYFDKVQSERAVYRRDHVLDSKVSKYETLAGKRK